MGLYTGRPLTDETRHLIRERELAMMKPRACLVSSSRGPVVDEVALVRALRERRIAGAGLDVYEHEPTRGSTELANVVRAVSELGDGGGAVEDSGDGGGKRRGGAEW